MAADLDRTRVTASQVLAAVTLLPICGLLIILAGITLVGTLICLALATPLFLICSPVLIPAAILFGGAVTGFLTSGAFGLTGLSSVSWAFDLFRRGPLEYAKQRLQEVKREQTKQNILQTKFAQIGL